MITFEKWAAEYTWKERRNSVNSFQVPNADIQPYNWSIIAKRNGKHFVKAHGNGGAEMRLPYQEFETVEDAKKWAMEYDYNRQRKLVENFRNDIHF